MAKTRDEVANVEAETRASSPLNFDPPSSALEAVPRIPTPARGGWDLTRIQPLRTNPRTRLGVSIEA
jgi:hypothetical protein